ncbi:hypothetical protein AAEO56_14105 [Flavobacterium sp. DGU11]|uniref:DUF4412 domain-containing protein n=1 Tax=Flavobacterium arundinis TaxID=3139143 RepID=A0ABU9HZ11_9FLAO
MKKITTLVVALLFTMGLQAQEVNFKVGYKQNTTYTQTTSQKTQVGVTYEGAEEPMEQESGSTITTKTTVGKLANNEMPIVMEISMEAGQQGADQMNGAKIYGKAKPGMMPTFERIEAPGMQDQVKDMLMGMMEKGLSQIFMPERKVKVGESFVQETPMDIPLGPVTMKMKDIATFKLKKVEGRKAFFDVTHVMTLEANIEGQDMKGSGTGSGVMIYDMDQNYPTSNDATVNMDMGFEAQGMKMNIKTTSETKAATVITASK